MSKPMFSVVLLFCHVHFLVGPSSPKAPGMQWTVAIAPAPMVTATILSSEFRWEWNITTETSTNSSLSVVKGAFVEMACVAKHPMLWYQMSPDAELFPVAGQRRTYNPYLERADNYTIDFGLPMLTTEGAILPANYRYIAVMDIARMNENDTGEYLCLNPISSTPGTITAIEVQMHEISDQPYAQVLQAGFESVVIPDQDGYYISVIYTTPVGTVLNHWVSLPTLKDKYIANQESDNIFMDWFIVKTEPITATISMSTLTLSSAANTVYKSLTGFGGDLPCEFVFESRLASGSLVSRGAGFKLVHGNYSSHPATYISAIGYFSELLVAEEAYEITMRLLPGRSEIDYVMLAGFEYVSGLLEGVCIPRPLQRNETVEVCGVQGFSYNYDESLGSRADDAIGFTIFVQSKVPCYFGISTQFLSVTEPSVTYFALPSLHTASLSYTNNTSSAGFPNMEEMVKSINESVTLSCLVPSCQMELLIGWCKLTDKRDYVACIWLPSQIISMPAWDFSPALIKDPSLRFDVGTIDPSTTYYRMTFNSMAMNHSGYYACIHNKRWLGKMEISPEGVYQLRVQDSPAPPASGGDAADAVRIALGSVLGIVFLVGSILTVLWLRKRRFIKNYCKQQAESLMWNPTEPVNIDENAFLNDQVAILPYNREYEVDRSTFTIGEKVGEGAFGVVSMGRFNGVDVVVKVPKIVADEMHVNALKDELNTLKLLSYIGRHINVLGLVAACTTRLALGELFVLTEYCAHKSLRDYLTKHQSRFIVFDINGRIDVQPGAVDMLLNFTCQAASGMEFLASKKFVHRDVAGQNIFLNSDHIVKIGDLGLAGKQGALRFGSRVSQYWTAPEGLQHQYSEKSDVWSFAIAVWEIFNCGIRQPYEGQEYGSLHEFLLYLCESEEHRLEQPWIACNGIYELLQRCWKWNPEQRPTFSECKSTLEQIFESYSSNSYTRMHEILDSATRKLERCLQLGSSDAPNSHEESTVQSTASTLPEVFVTHTICEAGGLAIPYTDPIQPHNRGIAGSIQQWSGSNGIVELAPDRLESSPGAITIGQSGVEGFPSVSFEADRTEQEDTIVRL